MLSLIFLPITIAVAIVKMTFTVLRGLFRSGAFIGAIAFFGVMSLLGGIISGIFGLVRSLLPLLLVVGGIALIAYANNKHPETIEQNVRETMDSFKEKIRRAM